MIINVNSRYFIFNRIWSLEIILLKNLIIRMYIQTCLWNLPFMLIFLCLTSHAQTSPPDTTQTICAGKLRGIRFRLIDEAKQWQGARGRILLTLSSVCDTAWHRHLCGLSRLHRRGWNTELKVRAQNADDNSLYPSCSSFDNMDNIPVHQSQERIWTFSLSLEYLWTFILRAVLLFTFRFCKSVP